MDQLCYIEIKIWNFAWNSFLPISCSKYLTVASKYLASDVSSTVPTNDIFSHWYMLWQISCLLRLAVEKVHLSCHSLSSLMSDLWKYAVTNLCVHGPHQALYTTEQTTQSEIEFSWWRAWTGSCRVILFHETVQIDMWINMISPAFTVQSYPPVKNVMFLIKSFFTERWHSGNKCKKKNHDFPP